MSDGWLHGSPPSGRETSLTSKLSNMRDALKRRDSSTRLSAVTYAATATVILLGLASSRSGSRTVSTPALY